MSEEFNWWLLIVGLVAGAGLTWLILAESSRRERDLDEREVPAEAAWVAGELSRSGLPVDPAVVETVLRAHRRYLGYPPPDALVDPAELEPAEPIAGPGSTATSLAGARPTTAGADAPPGAAQRDQPGRDTAGP